MGGILIRKILLATLMIIVLATLGCVNAADNETMDLMAVEDTTDSAPIVDSGAGDFSLLNDTITNAENPEIKLEKDYVFNTTKDDDFKFGINITRDNFVIDGNDHTIDGSNQVLIFHVYSNNVTLKNIRFINSIGAVEFDKNGIIEGSKFINNSGRAYGGAVIFKQNGEVTNCDFINNSASNGGAVYFINSGSIKNSNFSDNHGVDGGAVLFSKEGSVENCLFTGNTADSNNGGSVKFNQNGTVINSSFLNSRAERGGAIHIGNGRSIIKNSVFINNTATNLWGGAIFLAGNGIIDYCNFTNNGKCQYGGAIYTQGDDVTVKNSIFTNSSAKDVGGALFFVNSGRVENSVFINNHVNSDATVVAGGAIYFGGEGIVLNSRFIKNNATKYGGAIYVHGKATLRCSNFTDNEAQNGGAVSLNGKSIVIDSKFTNNNATNGGALYTENSFSDSKINSTFINNTANNGGAIYFDDEIKNITINGCFNDNDAERSGGAIYVKGKSTNNNFSAEFYNNHALQASGGAIFFSTLVENNIFESIFQTNYALYGGGIFFHKNAKADNNKFNSDFISNTAKSCGGAIFFYNTTDNNNFTGSFINNSALGQVDPENGNGGAITFKNVSTNCIFTCDFINNTARLNGGAVNYRETPSSIVFNSNFINNTAKTGGGVNFFKTFDVIFNGEFIGNSAVYGGAIAAMYGNIKNVSFKNNYVKKDGDRTGEGGAVYFAGSGETINCNFTNNRAEYRGGAVYFSDKCKVENCIFVENYAINDGGAVSSKSGIVLNSNFTGNAANNDGGAVYFSTSGNVTNCNFAQNSAPKGGALHFFNANNFVTNCSFVANKAANDGGAIYFMDKQENPNAINCYFEGNSANHEGGAIFCNRNASFTDSCIFKTDSDTTYYTINLTPILNVDDFNSVCGSDEKLTFNFTTHNGMPLTNGNILISVYFKDNDTWAGNYTCLSGEGWTVDLPVGSYYAVFNATEYKNFTSINRTIEIKMPDTQFYINVTSVTTTNKTVNITAKSNIPKNLLWDGKFLFILPDGTKINATYASNNTWWALHAFDHIGEYEVSASYVGLDNVDVKNATVTVEKSDSTITLDKTVVNYGDSINVKTEGAIGITAKIDGAEISVLDNHVIPLTGLNAGTYNLSVTTIPDDDHYSVTMNATITVSPIKTQLIGNAVTATYKANKYLVITLKDANGNPISGLKVTVALNGAKTYTTDKNGQVKVSTKVLAPKKYSATVTFNGNANYLKSTKTVKVTVKKATPKLTAKKKTFKKSVKVKKYKITLKYGKTPLKKVKVYIKIKSKTYKAKTNSKGKATFKIKKLTKKGTFKSKITFKGNKYYNKVTKKVKIKIR